MKLKMKQQKKNNHLQVSIANLQIATLSKILHFTLQKKQNDINSNSNKKILYEFVQC